MNDIMKIVKSLKESGLLLIDVNETIEKKQRFLGMLLGKLGASLLENIYTSKGKIRAGKAQFSLSLK